MEPIHSVFCIVFLVGIALLFRFGPSLFQVLNNKKQFGTESRLKLYQTIELDSVTEVYVLRFKKNRSLEPSERLERIIDEEYRKAGLAHAERHDIYDLSKSHALQQGFVSMILSSRVSTHEVLSIHVGPKYSEVASTKELPSPDKYNYLVAIKVGHVTEGKIHLGLPGEKSSARTAA